MYSKFRKLAPLAASTVLAASLLVAPLPHGLPLNSSPVWSQPAHAHAAQAAHESFRIVGIGDSLTAGYEYGMTLESAPYGYVERLFEQALFRGRSEVVNYGVLGLKTEGMRKWLAAVEAGQTVKASDIQEGLDTYPLAESIIAQTAQLRSDLQQASLVVITIGSNNFGELFEQLKDGRATADVWMDAQLEKYETDLEAALRTILVLQPTVQIIVSDIYSPVPNTKVALGAMGLLPDDYGYLLDQTAKQRMRLTAVIERFQAEGHQVQAAYSAEAFIGNESSYASLMQAGLAGVTDLHPTQKGYEAMANAYAKAIWGEYRTAQPRPADVSISVVVDGEELITDNKPVLKDNRTYLAFRDIADAMQATTKWDNETKTVTIIYGSEEVAITIGAMTMKVNGKTVAIDTPAFLHKVGSEQKTYVPLRVIADGLGFQVESSGKQKIAFINK